MLEVGRLSAPDRNSLDATRALLLVKITDMAGAERMQRGTLEWREAPMAGMRLHGLMHVTVTLREPGDVQDGGPR